MINFSAVGDQSFGGRLMRLPLRLLPKDCSLPILQGRLRGKKWIVGSGNHGCWLGSYENALRRIFEAEVGLDATVFDIGAHVGFYTLLSSVIVGPNGKVFAFEPSSDNLRYLEAHLELNGIRNATVVTAAVSRSNGTVLFSKGRDSSTGHVSSAGGLAVRAVGIDDFLADKGNLAPDFLKIDVEGGELEVLEGAKDTISRYHPTIFLETHGPDMHSACCQLLRSFGYKIENIEFDPPGRTQQVIARD